jgi:hypothetical protein
MLYSSRVGVGFIMGAISNQFAFVIETRQHVMLAGTDNGVLAYAMYRAALQEHPRSLLLRGPDRVLAPPCHPKVRRG